MTTDDGLQVVFGAGPIGRAIVSELSDRGSRVRVVNRSGVSDLPHEVDIVTGDASNSEFASKACEEASVVYFALNPPYTSWPELFPPLQQAVLQGASEAGARLVAMENLYGYGPVSGSLTENLPLTATGKKGRTRARMANELMEAHKAGRVEVAIGRASDFFGPYGLVSHVGERLFYPALNGKKAQFIAGIDTPHTYTFTRDIGRALVTLGVSEEAVGQAWHIPSPPTLTTREFASLVFREAGTELRVSVMPRFVLHALGLVNPIVREMKEVLHEFDEPFIVDHSKFADKFGVEATPHEEAIRTTLEWYRANPRA